MSGKWQRNIAWVLAFVLVSSLVRNWCDIGLDDSDLDGWNRSGVSIVTDYKTGLQYLSTWSGGITPRLDGNGKQVRIDTPARPLPADAGGDTNPHKDHP